MSGTTEPRDLTDKIDVETLLAVRQHALDMALGSDTPEGLNERPSTRRQRITADADTWSKFVLAGKIYGS